MMQLVEGMMDYDTLREMAETTALVPSVESKLAKIAYELEILVETSSGRAKLIFPVTITGSRAPRPD